MLMSSSAVKTDFVEVAGLRARLQRAGRGEPVILLHGLGASSYSWRYALPALAERYEVFAPDLPGFGRTDARHDFDYSIAGLSSWVRSLMDSLGLKSARFAGNSMGGVITLWTAMEAPERVERMALLGTPAYPRNRPKMLWPLSWPIVGAVYESMLGEAAVRWIAGATFVDKSKVTDELVAEYSHALKTPGGRRAVAEFVRRAIPPDHEARIERFKQLRSPALVIVGDTDAMVDRRGADRLASDLPNAKLCWLENCGHAPQEDTPERVNPLLAEFFA